MKEVSEGYGVVITYMNKDTYLLKYNGSEWLSYERKGAESKANSMASPGVSCRVVKLRITAEVVE